MRTHLGFVQSYVFVILGFAFPVVSGAQNNTPFIITGSVPANGATSVPSSLQVEFRFSEPFEATANYSSGLPIGIFDPNGTIIPRITGYTVSPDQLSLTLEISNPENSDLSLVITGAHRSDGQNLCKPFAFNYTTRPTLGSTSVSGMWFMVVTKGSSRCREPGVIAALFDAPMDQGGEYLYSAVSVGFDYMITGVRPGIYWPYYFYDMNNNGEIEPEFYAVGATGVEVSGYDSNQDGIIESISTLSGDLSGIHADVLLATLVEEETSLHDFILEDAYPNPFSPVTTIRYTLPRPSDARIEVYDLLGKRVRMLESGFKPSGEYEITFDASGLSSGVYFYTMKAEEFRETKKMMVTK
ncbi:MAG: hypothetical protein BMS9Abin05_1198 [Rhodothermia bacterium]|nr:MAG: hypothetical protein BMS9Abin05_1198 [Rhodothermia bacterium]